MNWRIAVAVVTAAAVMWACSSNNCPLSSVVTCNYHFYDSQGVPITYGDEITVTTLLQGDRTVYVYHKMGSTTIVANERDSALIAEGYTESVQTMRRDTVLVNKLSKASSLSLPMGYYNATDTVILSYATLTQRDTLYVVHDSYPYVELPECGVHQFHTLRSVTCSATAAIDHIEVKDKKVDYEGRENVRIYFNGEAEQQ